MPDILTAFLGWFAVWAVGAVGILELFERTDKALSASTRRRIARWLKRADPEKGLAPLANQFAGVFDSVFGHRHLSWRCFSRSLVASFASVALATLGSGVFAPERYAYEGAWSAGSLRLLVWTAVLTVLPGYLSLLKSRWIIGCMARSGSSAAVILLMIVDLALTTVVGVLGIWLGFATSLMLVFPQEAAAETVFSAGFLIDSVIPALLNKGPFTFLTACLWAAFFTAVWALSYGVSALTLRAAQGATTGLRLVRRWLNVDGKPVQSLGFIVAFFWSCLYILGFLWGTLRP